jgi:hypothetical protein
MALRLNMLSTALEGRVLQKGGRVFGLLGKATGAGVTSFSPEDIGRSWAVTAEFGCIRLERLSGDEEVTGLELFLPSAYSYDYGLTGTSQAGELSRMIFGLLPCEMGELMTALRSGSFPVLGFSDKDLKCCISSCVIPARWPHMVVSNQPICGNVVSVETFIRVLVSSLPHGQLTARLPHLRDVAHELLQLMGVQRPGIPYYRELLQVAPGNVMAGK